MYFINKSSLEAIATAFLSCDQVCAGLPVAVNAVDLRQQKGWPGHRHELVVAGIVE